MDSLSHQSFLYIHLHILFIYECTNKMLNVCANKEKGMHIIDTDCILLYGEA